MLQEARQAPYPGETMSGEVVMTVMRSNAGGPTFFETRLRTSQGLRILYCDDPEDSRLLWMITSLGEQETFRTRALPQDARQVPLFRGCLDDMISR